MLPGQDRIVLSPRYFHDNRNWLSKMSILYHELVHAIDPKSNPQGGKKSGELSLEILQKAKNMGISLKGMMRKEGLGKFVDHLIANEIESHDLYAASPTEYDAWISELCFGVEQYILNLDEGINTFVGERGVRLSGGQRQRIGIARALYHNPSVLILDEATSSLDNETEKGFMDAINNLKRDKTIIIVAHRLSTVSNCDKIFKLKSGKLIEEGIPEEVLQNS
jgi:hypothetical protein